MKRSIAIFPNLGDQADWIESIRAKYDRLHGVVAPHITLVFPFESDIAADSLERHIRSQIGELRVFEAVVTGISVRGRSLELEVTDAGETLYRLHDLLYLGLLFPYQNLAVPFRPHITIGRFGSPKQALEALDSLAGTVPFRRFSVAIKTITCEIIAEDHRSKVEFVVDLSTSQG